MKKNKLVKHILILTLLTLVLFGIHVFFSNHYFSERQPILSLTRIYLFHYITSLVFSISLTGVSKFDFDKIGFGFMAVSILKMLASIVFLLPLIQTERLDVIPDVLHFFIPYFIYLLVEIWFGLQLVNADEDTPAQK